MTDQRPSGAEHSAISSVTIIGHGCEAWLATNYLLAAYGSKNIEIRVFPAEGSDALDELYAILADGPDAELAACGLSGSMLARHCEASFSLGARITGRLKPYGSVGLDFLGLPFHHHWLRAFSGKGPDDYFNWSPATLAMKHGNYAPPMESRTTGLPVHGMAHHVNISALTLFLRERAIRNGVTVVKGALQSVVRENGSNRISGLKSDRGEWVEADLYIDCSGLKQAAIRGATAHEWVKAHSSDTFRFATSRSHENKAVSTFHTLEATESGWELEIPGSGWISRITLSKVRAGNGEINIEPGHLASPWIENCIAMGTASAVFLPVEPIQFRYFARSIRRMLDLLPGRDCNPVETAEYNRLNSTDAEELEDLTGVYELARKQENLSLAAVDFGQAPERLQKRLELFTKRGRTPRGDCDFLEAGDWAATLILLGLNPTKHDRLIERMPIDTLRSHLNKLKVQIETTASKFPPHDVYLNAVKSSRQAAPR